MNEEIFVPHILLIGDDGHKFGEIGIDEAAPSRKNRDSIL